MGLFDSLDDFVSDVLTLPIKVLKIPANVVAEAAATLDPTDDAAIKSTAREIADTFNTPLDVAERAIRDTFS